MLGWSASEKAKWCSGCARISLSRDCFFHSRSFGRMQGIVVSFIFPRARLWRITSKTDTLDDDETPLRLAASPTATTRGVMVSGIMGALDIAPT